MAPRGLIPQTTTAPTDSGRGLVYGCLMTPYALLVDRVDTVSPLLGDVERPLAERVIGICRELDRRERRAGQLVPEARDLELKRELGALSEQLGRRTSAALPAATLGRAALADLHGDPSSFRRVIADCEAKLALLGY
jgi:hypothetical protein